MTDPLNHSAQGMQLQLPMLTSFDGPSLVPEAELAKLLTYRAAVRYCWAARKRTRMTMRLLAEEACLYPSHVTDYLHSDDDPRRRDLPSKAIAAVEVACGNRAISQWVAKQSQLPVLQGWTEPAPQRRVA